MKYESVRHVNLVPIFSNSFSFSNSWGKEERRRVKRGSRYFFPNLDVLKIKREERRFDVVDPLIML